LRPKAKPVPRHHTYEAAAVRLEMCVRSVMRAVALGKLSRVMIRNRAYITDAELERYARELETPRAA
jgi:hypothetical protein